MREKKIMPRTKWKRSKDAGKLFLAKDKVEVQGTLLKCRRCPVVNTCENVQYRARGLTYFFCIDNPKERGRYG